MPSLRPLALALPLVFPAVAIAQQGPDDGVQSVRVTAARAQGFVPYTVEAGTFRGSDIMDVPSTVNVITREVLELQAAGGLYDAVRNTAGVTRQQNGGDTWDQLVVRGIAVENRTNYRLNGSLPIMNFSQVALENKERVEVLKGATALYYGFTSPAGVVNFVTRRAGAAPVTTVGLAIDDNGSAVASADVARRFGARRQVGVRINAAGGTLGSHMHGVGNGNRAFVSAALDWQVDRRLRVKADLEVDRRRVTEQAGIALPAAVDGAITLPRAVDPRRPVGPDWALFRAETTNAQLRADYALPGDWALTLEAGRARTERDRNLAIFRFAGGAAVATGAGRIAGNSQHLGAESDMLRTELAGRFATGSVDHDITVGIARTDKGQDPVYQANYTIPAQNLYDPLPVANATFGAVPATPTTAALDSRDTGVYAVDRMTFSPRWQAVAGVRAAQFRSDQGGNRYDVSKATPMGALVYRAGANLSFYASAAQGLEEGETAPTRSANAGERMAPGVSRQKELGLRWQAGGDGTLVQLALFDIRRPGYYTNAANVFTADGRQRYRGVEVQAQGRMTDRLSWQASAQGLDPRFADIGAAYDGKLPENAARRTASTFVSYDVAALPGLAVNAGAWFTGRRPVNDLDQAFLGGTTLFSAGARYVAPLMGRRTTWQLNVDNAADKRYWAGAGTRLSAGMPRLIKLSVKTEL